MNPVFVNGLGVAAPGLVDWPQARDVLRGVAAYDPSLALPAFKTALLPRNEARRAGTSVKLAFRVAEQACDPANADELTTVFASAGGDINIADQMCRAVNAPDHPVSPTKFHNSVHNAPVGYWTIATGSRLPATSLAAGHDGFAIALTEAWATLAAGESDVLLVCYEIVGDGLLQAARPSIHGPFGVALRLSRAPDTGTVARLSRPQTTSDSPDVMRDRALEVFRARNPSARCLPLLSAVANNTRARVTLATATANLAIDIAPASS